MHILRSAKKILKGFKDEVSKRYSSLIVKFVLYVKSKVQSQRLADFTDLAREERGDVPGWVLVVLMTTGLVTAIWTIAAPRLSSILRNSLDSMNAIR